MSKPRRGAPGRPRDAIKHAAILEAAKTLFLKNGFEGTSMDAIAGAAGVSKLTVYNHFQDKENLFYATIESKCSECIPTLENIPQPTELIDYLKGLGRQLYRLANGDESIALHRLMISQADSNPALAARMYHSCFDSGLNQLSAILNSLCSNQLLQIADTSLAAQHFFSLVRGNHTLQRLVGYRADYSEQEIDSLINDAVLVFLRAYQR